MGETRWERMAALAGLVFVALMGASMLLVNSFEFMPPSEEIRSFYTENDQRLRWAAYVGVVSGFFLLAFAGALRSRLGTSEGEGAVWSSMASAGGVAAGALVIVGYAAMAAAAERAGTAGGVGTETVTALADLQSAVFGVGLPVAVAALTGAASVASLRSGILPGWLAWAGLVLAVGLLTPVGYAVIGVAVVWIAVVGVVLSRPGRVHARAQAAEI